MHARPSNPFVANPFSSKPEPVLLVIPEAPETHEARKPLRTYLAPAGGGMGMLDGLMGGRPAMPKKIERLQVVYRDPPQDPADE